MATFLYSLAIYTGLSFAVESLFTGMADLVRAHRRGRPLDPRLPCRTQLWGVLVYGMSAALSYNALVWWWPEFYGFNWVLRGTVYMLGIFAWEFFWGYAISLIIGFCPWKYSDSRWRLLRYINPWYAPFWFGFGFLLEWTRIALIPAVMAATW